MESLIERIEAFGFPPEIQVLIIAALPVLELRGAIPYGVWVLKLSPFKTLLFALIGNLLVIMPVLFILDVLITRFEKFEIGKKLVERAKRRGKLVEKFELLGLFLFVAIPLPGTGAWTGALLSFVFGIRKRLAIPSISLGIIMAGLIVTLIVSFGTLKGVIIGILFLAGMSKMLDYITNKK